MPSPGICEQVILQRNRLPFTTTLFAIPLASMELVLGVKWLRVLGSIWWDFSTLTMSFMWQGKQVSFTGDSEQQFFSFISLQPVQKNCNNTGGTFHHRWRYFLRTSPLCHHSAIVITGLCWLHAWTQ